MRETETTETMNPVTEMHVTYGINYSLKKLYLERFFVNTSSFDVVHYCHHRNYVSTISVLEFL